MSDQPHTGLLHQLLNVAPDQEIPQERLREGTRSNDPRTRFLSTVAHSIHLRDAAKKAAADTGDGKA